MNSNRIDKPDEQLGYLLMQVSLLKQRILNSALKCLDLTYMQFVVLAGVLELSEENHAVTQQCIVLERHLDKAMVSNVVKTLLAKGLIERNSHPGDSRAWMLNLTIAGEKRALEAKKITEGVNSNFFMNIDEGTFRLMLKKLLSDNI
ncbi:MarR family transcriptional regulator [Dysgonomonas sp. 216]|uniref:MarR family winged helix-turn-helix transcriptional regulator n=1 Tax=Dysgonomonas sp. 216 TaxID=2302934 RepID=UPI0013CFFCB7|nr:MarR family transcriptional regulator [Dysgonomonas sp. 216]NDW18410.1 MarR family transcriptional regulator [Dysgonomonas sp. 216]